jgi:hypothetical protein
MTVTLQKLARKCKLDKIDPILIRPKCKNNIFWCIWLTWATHKAAISALNEYAKSDDPNQALTIEPTKDKPPTAASRATGPTPPA